MKRILRWLFLSVFVVYSLIPMVIVIFTSLKTPGEMFVNVIAPPKSFYFGNYINVWIGTQFWRFFINSLIISIPTVIIVVACSIFAGFAFAKLKFFGKNVIFFIFLIGLVLPIPSIMIPIYINLAKMGLLNTYIGVILTQVAIDLPFGIFLMRSFFADIPEDILESARMDGASEFTVIGKMILPLARPVIGALILIEFMWAWQSYLVPLFIITKDSAKPLTVAMSIFISRYSTSYTNIAAAAVIVFIPMALVFLFTQRKFMEGLTMGYNK
ncbi:MAG: carbohydrate ABC transporter permease [Candidatus Humimicrobiaceae bacterium]